MEEGKLAPQQASTETSLQNDKVKDDSALNSVAPATTEPLSDSDSSKEPPVRQKLEKASINNAPKKEETETVPEIESSDKQKVEVSKDNVESKSEASKLKPQLNATNFSPLKSESSIKDTGSLSGSENAMDASAYEASQKDVQMTTADKSPTPSSQPAKTATRKRSFDSVESEQQYVGSDDSSPRDRKRSRSMSPNSTTDSPKMSKRPTRRRSRSQSPLAINKSIKTTESGPIDDKEQKLMSPKKKRSRDQFDRDQLDEHKTAAGAAKLDDEKPSTRLSGESERGRGEGEEPEKKRHRDLSQEKAELKQGNGEPTALEKSGGFGNTAALSPFTTGSKSPNKASDDKDDQTESSKAAFAASGFGALASSAASPFGSFGGASAGLTSFAKAGGASKTKGASGLENGASKLTEPLSSFASGFKAGPLFGGSGSSGFGSLGGKLGSGFGQPLGSLRGFGTPGVTKTEIAEKSNARAFGAPEEEDTEESENDSGDETTEIKEDGAGKSEKKTKQDYRFKLQEVDTGEDGEETVFSCRAKLFVIDRETKGWKERGVGSLKVNAPGYTSIFQEPSKPRIIMRSDGVMKVLLNAPLSKEMKPEVTSNQPNVVSMLIFEDGKPLSVKLRINSSINAKLLCQHIDERTTGV
ncbi:MAG: hypothetical protein M1814_001748 [Vezdaea aestivalis]|nr:MAG: hypothetical protein M1814_001748 [Vezdaea aestivalis]